MKKKRLENAPGGTKIVGLCVNVIRGLVLHILLGNDFLAVTTLAGC